MLYLNQLAYPAMAYPTNVRQPESEWAVHGTVSRAGCGLCAVCMAVDRLTAQGLTLEQARALSAESGANWEIGTDMKRLAPAVAERFGLELLMTDDIAVLKRGLRDGGAAVINVGGDQGGVPGVFSQNGHYLTAIAYRAGQFCLLDPSLTEEKYALPPRSRLVRRDGIFLYASAAVLRRDTAARTPAYYLFRRRGPDTPPPARQKRRAKDPPVAPARR